LGTIEKVLSKITTTQSDGLLSKIRRRAIAGFKALLSPSNFKIYSRARRKKKPLNIKTNEIKPLANNVTPNEPRNDLEALTKLNHVFLARQKQKKKEFLEDRVSKINAHLEKGGKISKDVNKSVTPQRKRRI